MISVPESLRVIADRLAEERADARAVIPTLRNSLDASFDRPLPESWKTLGMVQDLTSAAEAVVEQNPMESRALAQFALAVASSVPRASYPAIMFAQIEGKAWKALGFAHRYLTAHDAALRAYDVARRLFGAFGALANEAAAVDLAKAVVFSETGKLAEALAFIASAADVFESFSDEKRLLQATMLKGLVHYRRGNFKAARVAYEEVLKKAEHRDDLHTLAATYTNLALVLIELDETTGAADFLARARELFSVLDMPIEVRRTEGSLGRLLMKKGDYEHAIPLLKRLREHFLSLNLIDEAGVAGLDMVDALVATNNRAAAQQLTETVLAEFRAANLDRAIVALAYLRDLLREHPAPAASIRHVRSFVAELRRDPARVFLPLPE